MSKVISKSIIYTTNLKNFVKNFQKFQKTSTLYNGYKITYTECSSRYYIQCHQVLKKFIDLLILG